MDCTKKLSKDGYTLDRKTLESVQSVIAVKIRNGKSSITDGPFAENKELLVGFYPIEARGLNEAIQVASKIPPARVGRIEVRCDRELIPNT